MFDVSRYPDSRSMLLFLFMAPRVPSSELWWATKSTRSSKRRILEKHVARNHPVRHMIYFIVGALQEWSVASLCKQSRAASTTGMRSSHPCTSFSDFLLQSPTLGEFWNGIPQGSERLDSSLLWIRTLHKPVRADMACVLNHSLLLGTCKLKQSYP